MPDCDNSNCSSQTGALSFWKFLKVSLITFTNAKHGTWTWTPARAGSTWNSSFSRPLFSRHECEFEWSGEDCAFNILVTSNLTMKNWKMHERMPNLIWVHNLFGDLLFRVVIDRLSGGDQRNTEPPSPLGKASNGWQRPAPVISFQVCSSRVLAQTLTVLTRNLLLASHWNFQRCIRH